MTCVVLQENISNLKTFFLKYLESSATLIKNVISVKLKYPQRGTSSVPFHEIQVGYIFSFNII